MPTPTLLLRPEGSQDDTGAVTITQNGTVSVVAGTHGQAWDLSGGGYLTCDRMSRLDPAQGTMLMRLTTPVLASLAFLYESTLGTEYHRIFLSSSRTLTTRIGAGTSSRSSGLVVPDSSLQVAGATWQASGHQGYVNSTAGPSFADALPTTLSTGMWFGSSTSGTFLFPGQIESVLVYDTVLSDADIATLSTMANAWTWDGVIAALEAPGRSLHPVLKIGASHIGPLRVGKD